MPGRIDVAADACWRTAGRPGPGTCPQLSRHVVCRNCPTYAAAALRLLDQAPPAGYVRQWTEHLSAAAAEADRASVPVFVFRLGAEWLALPAAIVEQVVDDAPVHTLPHRRAPVRGLVSVRGELVLCVRLERLLGITDTIAAGAPSRTVSRLIVVAAEDGRVAFQAAEVRGLHRYQPAELRSVPSTLASAAFAAGLVTVGERTVACLDAGRVLAAIAGSFS